MKTQLTLASVIAAGLLASGCSQQMVAQQAVAEPQPVVKTVVDCSKCGKPTPVKPKPAANNKWAHTHPAIPGCTDSKTHTHKYNNRNHSHKYSCKKAAPRPAPKPAPVVPESAPVSKPAPVRHVVPTPRPMKRCWHGRNAQGQCNPKPNVRRPVYRPRPMPKLHKPVMPVVPKVKAKGTYRGPIQIDGVMQQYQQ